MSSEPRQYLNQEQMKEVFPELRNNDIECFLPNPNDSWHFVGPEIVNRLFDTVRNQCFSPQDLLNYLGIDSYDVFFSCLIEHLFDRNENDVALIDYCNDFCIDGMLSTLRKKAQPGTEQLYFDLVEYRCYVGMHEQLVSLFKLVRSNDFSLANIYYHGFSNEAELIKALVKNRFEQDNLDLSLEDECLRHPDLYQAMINESAFQALELNDMQQLDKFFVRYGMSFNLINGGGRLY